MHHETITLSAEAPWFVLVECSCGTSYSIPLVQQEARLVSRFDPSWPPRGGGLVLLAASYS